MAQPRHPDDRRLTARTARRVLIAAEGRATEAPYFEAIRRHLHLPTQVVTVLDNKGSSPISLVRGVIQVRDRLIDAGGFDAHGGDTAWAVFDGDEHRHSDPKGWAEAHRLAEKAGVRLAVSNPSFELWFLLHFEDQFAPLDAAGAIGRLKRHLPRYKKGLALFPDPLLPLTQAAIDRAGRLAERARREGTGEAHPNPSTGVAALVDHLFALGT
ncbi:MAG: RloB family protein [Candidatus Sericytochromatia bacterium]